MAVRETGYDQGFLAGVGAGVAQVELTRGRARRVVRRNVRLQGIVAYEALLIVALLAVYALR